MKHYDLRSDTVTLPMTEMKDAMFSAPLGAAALGSVQPQPIEFEQGGVLALEKNRRQN